MARARPPAASGTPERLPRAPEQPSQNAVSGRSTARQRVALRWVVGALSVATAFRLGLMLRGWPALDSDEAIIGLMARHILSGGERPIFYYGQHYLGALDAYVAAGAFALLGPTALALHLSMLPFTIGFLLAAYALGRAAYGSAVGLLTLAFLAVGPAYGLLRETAAIGGYQETLLLGGAMLLLVYARLCRSAPLPQGRAEWVVTLGWYALIGLLAGLGLWSDQLILPIVGAAVLALVCGRTREVRHLPALALVAGLIVGAWPLLIYNVQHGGVTFSELASQNRVSGQIGPLPPLGAWLSQIGALLAVGAPAVLGSPHVCIASGGTWPSYPPALAAVGQPATSVCGAVNLLFAVGALVCYGVAAAPLVRSAWLWWQPRPWRSAAAPPVDRRHADRYARRWLRAMLVLSAAGTLLLYSVSKTAQLYQFTAARYLLPLYLTLPILFGVLWEQEPVFVRWVATAVRGRADPRLSRPRTASEHPGGWRADPRLAAALAAASLVLLLGFSLYGAAATAAWASDGARFALPAPPTDQRLIATLEAHGVATFVSDYWTCYRLAFESSERLRCAVWDGVNGTLTGNGAVNRYLPYLEEVERAPHPAYLFPAGSSQDATFDAWATAQHLPHLGYARLVAQGEAIYYAPAPPRA